MNRATSQEDKGDTETGEFFGTLQGSREDWGEAGVTAPPVASHRIRRQMSSGSAKEMSMRQRFLQHENFMSQGGQFPERDCRLIQNSHVV